jgi:hypothetical protein
MRLTLSDGGGPLEVIVKSKPLDRELILAANRIAGLCGGPLADEFARWQDWTGFKGTHTRELQLYRTAPPALRAVMPELYAVHSDPAREAHLLVLEDIDASVHLKDTADDVGGWRRAHVESALTGVAGVHAHWLGREQELLDQEWLGPVLDSRRMGEMRGLWLTMAEHNATAHPHWIDARLRDLAATVHEWWGEIEQLPRTLVHNDFNPRNIALRRDSGRLVAYDWELATLHLPQRDLAELLAFVLPPDTRPEVVTHYVDFHRRALERAADTQLDPEQWRRGYRLALHDFATTRLGLYMVSHTQREFGFLDRVVATVKRLLDVESGPVRLLPQVAA